MSDSIKKSAFLGMASYGDMTAGAARGFFTATKGAVQVTQQFVQGSLLAQGFNALWCSALNRVHHGIQTDYFAMIHADIEPEDGWLDVLVEELESRNLDVLGVAVPIKDHKGITSLALAREDGDTWSPKCRLSMQEVFALPETFTSEDIGHPLLLNTGLWVCRFNPEWALKVRFTINDRIVFDRQKDCYIAQVEPEDWYFSRLLHELGLKIGATRKVRCQHKGHTSFTNECPWGTQDFDASYLSESVLKTKPVFVEG